MSLFDQLVDQAINHNTELANLRVVVEKAAQRSAALTDNPQVKLDFRNEMQRFLPAQLVAQTVNNDKFWDYLAAEIPLLMRRAENSLKPEAGSDSFMM